jgi:hypothetical protein
MSRNVYQFRSSVIKTEIAKCRLLNPAINRWIDNVIVWFEAVDIISSVRTFDDKSILDFIHGMAFTLPISLLRKDPKDAELFNRRTSPVLSIITDYMQNEYREYLIDKRVKDNRVIAIDGTTIPITKDEINNFIVDFKRYPILPKDLDIIQVEYEQYQKSLRVHFTQKGNDLVEISRELQSEVRELKHDMDEILADQNDINEDTRMQLELVNQTLAELQTDKQLSDKPRRRVGFHRDE